MDQLSSSRLERIIIQLRSISVYTCGNQIQVRFNVQISVRFNVRLWPVQDMESMATLQFKSTLPNGMCRPNQSASQQVISRNFPRIKYFENNFLVKSYFVCLSSPPLAAGIWTVKGNNIISKSWLRLMLWWRRELIICQNSYNHSVFVLSWS